MFNRGNSSVKRFTILAEIASCQLEYSYLAKLTGKKEHYDRVSYLENTVSVSVPLIGTLMILVSKYHESAREGTHHG